MSRQYSLFSSSKAKARREKFALTRKSLSEHWENSSGEEERLHPGFPDLPSPTIGIHRDVNSLLLSSSPPSSSGITTATFHPHVSPLALFNSSDVTKKSPPVLARESLHNFGRGNTTTTMSCGPLRDGSSSKSKSTFQFCNRDVSIQCNIAAAKLSKSGIKDESHLSKKKRSLLKAARLWKSFDWGEFTQWSSPPWEPFHPNSKSQTKKSNPPLAVNKVEDEGGGSSSKKLFRQRQNEPPTRLDLTGGGSAPMMGTVCENCARIVGQNQAFQQLRRTTGTNTSFHVCKKHLQSQEQEPPIPGPGPFQPIQVDVNSEEKPSKEKSSIHENNPNPLPSFKGNRSALAFSLPIPQVAMQYANIPGDHKSQLLHQQHQQQLQQGTTGSTQPMTSNHPISSRPVPTNLIPNSKLASVGVDFISVAEAEAQRGKSSTLPTIDSKHILAIRNAEKRRRFFAKKQTNSAPDTYEPHHTNLFNATQNVLQNTRRLCNNCKEPVTNCLDGVLRATWREKGDTSTITPPSVEVWESEIRAACCGDVTVTHVSELDYPDADPPCHFCCEQASTAIHDESRLQIVSGGLVRSRDGSTRTGQNTYINLPSPNVQAENGQQSFGSLDLSPSMSMSQNLLSPGSHHALPCSQTQRLSCVSSGTTPPSRGGSIPSVGGGNGKEEEDPLVGPPASALTRRPALVPPKLIPDPDYENDTDRDRNFGRCSDDMTSPRNRRSSIVVIPPMQICPGDLLVYGKVLSQRKSLLGTPIESPSPIPTIFDTENTQARKKATWSLLKLFERGSRAKGGPSGTLEEIMSLIQPCDFSDPKLSRFKGMVWSDFVAHVSNQKTKKSGSVVSSGSSSGPSTSSSVNDFKIKPDNLPGIQNLSISTVTTKALVTDLPISPAMSPTAIITSTVLPEKPMGPPAKVPPLVRKRMGLMRTMSDRCLDRRAPALFRGNQGFLMSEKLVEGKETETPGSSNNATKNSSSSVSASKPLIFSTSQTKGSEPTTTVGINAKETSETVGQQQGVIKSSGDETDPDHRQKVRQKEALWDLFQSECSFLYDHLMVLKNVFMEPLKRIQVEGFAMYAEPELLFGNLDELCAVTYAFCKEFIHLLLTLTDNFGELVTTEVLAKLFEPSSKARAVSQAYHRYALNYINALNYLETLRRHVEFCDFEKLCMKDPRCKKLQLTDLLVSPVQHLMKVPLILKDIQSRTNEPQEKELISQILEIQENSIRELDDKMRWLKNFERLLEIQRNIVWPSILEMEPKTWIPETYRALLQRQPCDSIVVSPRRQIIHEGLLQLWDTGKPSECYVILFDDMLLITRRKKGLSKKKSSLTENWQSACGKTSSVVGGSGETNHRYIVYRQPISLDRFVIHDVNEGLTEQKPELAFVLVSLNRFQQIIAVHTFQAPAEQIKMKWLEKLRETQDKWKRTLQTTVFRGVRSSTDSGQSNVASSILGLAHNKSFLHRHNTCESSS